MIIWKILVEQYERYNPGRKKKIKIEENTLKEALLKFIDQINVYQTEEDIEELYEELSGDETKIKNAFVQMIELSNGDGCDFIITWEDENGDLLIDYSDYPDDEDEW